MKQRPSTRGGSSLVCFYIDYWFLLLIIISIFDYRNVMASVWCPVNPRMVILLESSLCLCIARVYAARIFWILYLCVTMSLNEGRESFFFSSFFFVPFLCMNQGWQNALWIKLGWREGFGEITQSLVHIKVHSAQWHVIPRARHHTRQS